MRDSTIFQQQQKILKNAKRTNKSPFLGEQSDPTVPLLGDQWEAGKSFGQKDLLLIKTFGQKLLLKKFDKKNFAINFFWSKKIFDPKKGLKKNIC